MEKEHLRKRLVEKYGDVFQGTLGDYLEEVIASGDNLSEVSYYLDMEAERVHGELVHTECDGTVITVEGNHYEWIDLSYRDADTGYMFAREGSWEVA